MKKFVSVLLIMLLLCGGVSVAASAASSGLGGLLQGASALQEAGLALQDWGYSLPIAHVFASPNSANGSSSSSSSTKATTAASTSSSTTKTVVTPAIADFLSAVKGPTKVPTLENLLKGFDLENMTDAQLSRFVQTLNGLKKLGVDIPKYLEPAASKLSIPVKAALHEAGLVSYPIYERSLFWNFIFKYFLFGWIWM